MSPTQTLNRLQQYLQKKKAGNPTATGSSLLLFFPQSLLQIADTALMISCKLLQKCRNNIAQRSVLLRQSSYHLNWPQRLLVRQKSSLWMINFGKWLSDMGMMWPSISVVSWWWVLQYCQLSPDIRFYDGCAGDMTLLGSSADTKHEMSQAWWGVSGKKSTSHWSKARLRGQWFCKRLSFPSDVSSNWWILDYRDERM